MIYSKKHSHIKKQVIAQKYSNLLRTNKYVFFFHSNGAGECNWEQMKKKLTLSCKSLLVPKGLYRRTLTPTGPNPKKVSCTGGRRGDVFFTERDSLIQGGLLLVACSSPEECLGIVTAPPSFLLLGGMYHMRAVNHLDCERLISLHQNGAQVHQELVDLLIQYQGLFLAFPTSVLNGVLGPTLLHGRKLLAQLHALPGARSGSLHSN